MAVDKWNDDRLDELNRRLIKVEDVNTTVAIVKTRLDSLEANVKQANLGITKISNKVGQIIDEPLSRARDFRRQVWQGVIAAAAGGIVVFGATVLAGLVH